MRFGLGLVVLLPRRMRGSVFAIVFVLAMVVGHAPGGAQPRERPVRVVYGWFPYWQPSSALELVDAAMVTHVAWFACDVDTATGRITDVPRWRSSPAIPWAQRYGLHLDLTITCFGTESNRALLSTPTRRAACISSIVQAIADVPGCGVNIDFESVPQSMRQNLVAFSHELRAALPTHRLSICLPAVDWSNAFDMQALATIYDLHIVMCYDYSWSGSPTAGPVAPLRGEAYNAARSMEAFHAAGAPLETLVMGMPLYGYSWVVASAQRKSAVVPGARAQAFTMANVMQIPGYANRQHDVPTLSAWTVGNDGSNLVQSWWDDSLSRVEKLRYVQQQRYAGVALWALGYDRGAASVWQPFRDAVPTTSIVAEQDTTNADPLLWYVDVLGRVLAVGGHSAGQRLPAGRYFTIPVNGQRDGRHYER